MITSDVSIPWKEKNNAQKLNGFLFIQCHFFFLVWIPDNLIWIPVATINGILGIGKVNLFFLSASEISYSI